MSDCVVKNLPLLEKLAKAKPSERKKILLSASLQLIRSIVECIENVLKGIVKLKIGCLKKLKKHKKVLRAVYSGTKKLRDKKKVIIQSGGSFLPILLTPIISLLADKLLNRIS